MCRIRAAEDPRRGYVREKVLPGDAVAVEQVQNGSRDGAIPTEGRRGGRDDLRGREMAEGGRRERVRAIRKRRSDHRREVPIADRERLGEPVIEGQVAIVVVPHRLVFGVALPGVDLLRRVVHAHEAVIRAVPQRIRRMVEVRLLVRSGPPVVEVRFGAVVGQFEGADPLHPRRRIGVEVPVAAVETGPLPLASETVDAAMVASCARAGMIWTARHVRQHPEVVVERMVFLHHDDDVVHLAQVALRVGGDRDAGQHGDAEERRSSTSTRTKHGDPPIGSASGSSATPGSEVWRPHRQIGV